MGIDSASAPAKAMMAKMAIMRTDLTVGESEGEILGHSFRATHVRLEQILKNSRPVTKPIGPKLANTNDVEVSVGQAVVAKG